MGNITIAALAGTVVQITQELAAFLWHCLIIVAVLLVFSLILPEDPFQNGIIQISGTLSQWSDFVSYFIPIRWIITTTLFSVVFRYFFYIYQVFSMRWAILASA
jgi:hypothetical protein